MSFTFIPNGQDVLLCSVCRPTLLSVSVGGFGLRAADSAGRFLHAKYVITDHENESIRPAITGLGTASDGAMVVELDFAGELQLNWPGSIYLIGGNSGDVYTVSAYRRLSVFERTWHPLTTLVGGGDVMVMPAHHTRASAHATVTAFINGNPGELNHWPIPVISGSIVPS